MAASSSNMLQIARKRDRTADQKKNKTEKKKSQNNSGPVSAHSLIVFFVHALLMDFLFTPWLFEFCSSPAHVSSAHVLLVSGLLTFPSYTSRFLLMRILFMSCSFVSAHVLCSCVSAHVFLSMSCSCEFCLFLLTWVLFMSGSFEFCTLLIWFSFMFFSYVSFHVLLMWVLCMFCSCEFCEFCSSCAHVFLRVLLIWLLLNVLPMSRSFECFFTFSYVSSAHALLVLVLLMACWYECCFSCDICS